MKWFYVLSLIVLISLILEVETSTYRSYRSYRSSRSGGSTGNTGVIIGIVFGALVAVGGIIFVIVFICCLKQNAARAKVGNTQQTNTVFVASNGYGKTGYSNYGNYSNSSVPPPSVYNPPYYPSPEYPPKKE